MDPRLELVRSDLHFVFDRFPLECLRFVRENRSRLIRRQDRDEANNGCLFGLLSRTLPPSQQIGSREDLARYFVGGSTEAHRELPEYAPAKWLVRLVDGEKVQRYEGLNFISWDFIIECLDKAIARREAIETESAKVEKAAMERLRERHPIASEV